MVIHISEESIEQYALGRLSSPESNVVEEHLKVCRECQDRLQETRIFLAAVRSAAQKLRDGPPS